MEQAEVILARHDERITGLEEWRDSHEQKQNSSLDKVFAELKEIRSMLVGRPTWSVSIVVTVLSSSVVGLAVYVLTKGR